MTNKELANHLGLKLTKLRMFLYEMGLKRMELQYWTEEQVQFLKENYREKGDKELAEIFNSKWHKKKGWTLKHIEKKRMYLNLKRTPCEIKKIKDGHKTKGAFRHGKTWKTRGVSTPGTIKVWRNQFGKPFLVIKTVEGFVHYNRYLWQKHHGPIPEDMIIRTKDDNPLNITIENLVMIDRSENAIRNTEKYRSYPGELKDAIKSINQINKILNNVNKKQTVGSK